MRMAKLVQADKRLFDIGIDPCVAPLVGRLCAAGDYPGKCCVRRHTKALLPDCLGQRFGQVKAIKRENRAALRLYPECVGIIARIRHRENAAGISAHEQIKVDGH